MELFLWIVLVVFIAVFFMIALKLLWTYEQPEDDWRCGTILPKTTFVLSIALACLVTLTLPLDVENARETGEGLPDMWSVLYWMILSFSVIIIPLASFAYEATDDVGVGRNSRVRFMMIRILIVFMSVTAAVTLLYLFANSTTVPVTEYTCVNYVYDSAQTLTPSATALCTSPTLKVYLKMSMSLSNYIVALTSFIGWWLLVVFGSVGLTALPMDLIHNFLDRPTKADLQKYNAQKRAIGEQSRELAKHGKELQQKELELRSKLVASESKGKASVLSTAFSLPAEKLGLQRQFNKFRQSVYLLEMEYKKIEISLKDHGENPVISYAKLTAGVVGFIFAIVWIVHCLLFICLRSLSSDNEPVSAFLNDALEFISQGDGYIASFFIFVLISLYLLATVVKGAFKYGMKLFCLPIFPLRERDTPINSLLFNAILVLLSSGAVAHLMYMAFQDYAYAASANFLFGTEITYLDFFRFFFDNSVIVWVYVGFSLVSCCFIVFAGRDEPGVKLAKTIEDLMAKHGLSDSEIQKVAKGSSIRRTLYDSQGKIKI